MLELTLSMGTYCYEVPKAMVQATTMPGAIRDGRVRSEAGRREGVAIRKEEYLTAEAWGQ